MSTAGGSVSFDPATNALIVTDSPAVVQKMMSVIEELDRMQSQITQVHIEAKIAEVESTAAKEIGVRWFIQGDHAGGGYAPNPRQDTRVNSVRTFNDPLFRILLLRAIAWAAAEPVDRFNDLVLVDVKLKG